MHISSRTQSQKAKQKLAALPYNGINCSSTKPAAILFYVSNITEETKNFEIKSHFEQFGHITELKVAHLKDGRCKGHAKLSIILHRSASSSSEKGKVDKFFRFKHFLNGKQLRVEKYIQSKEALSSKDMEIVNRRICVLNIPPNQVSDEKLKAIFEYFFGKVYGAYVRLKKKKVKQTDARQDPSKFMHYGFVTFETESSVDEALKIENLILKKADWNNYGYQGQGVCYPYKYEENSKDDNMKLGERPEYMTLQIKPFLSKNKKEKARKNTSMQGMDKVSHSNKLLGSISIGVDLDKAGSKMMPGGKPAKPKDSSKRPIGIPKQLPSMLNPDIDNFMHSMAKNQMFGMKIKQDDINFANANIKENMKHLLVNISKKEQEGAREHPLVGYGSKIPPFQGVGSFGFMETLMNKSKPEKKKRKKKKKAKKKKNEIYVGEISPLANQQPVQKMQAMRVQQNERKYIPNLDFTYSSPKVSLISEFRFLGLFQKVDKSHCVWNIRMNKSGRNSHKVGEMKDVFTKRKFNSHSISERELNRIQSGSARVDQLNNWAHYSRSQNSLDEQLVDSRRVRQLYNNPYF
jgi:hypothetical protein